MIFEEQSCSTNTHLFESTEKQDENSFSARIEGMWTCLHEIQYGILLQIWHWHNALQFGTYFHNMAWDMKPIWAGLSKNGEPMGGPSKLYCMVEHYFPNWNSHIICIIYDIYIYIIWYIYMMYIYMIHIYIYIYIYIIYVYHVYIHIYIYHIYISYIYIYTIYIYIYISYIYHIYIHHIYIYTVYHIYIYIYVGGKSRILDKTRYHINCYKHTHTHIYIYIYIYIPMFTRSCPYDTWLYSFIIFWKW